ncbi:MAG TPA: beta-galactosidase, partial [Armatimonadota bacterium]|nr:beta-galactosidase [Armatimonadota bacterium]
PDMKALVCYCGHCRRGFIAWLQAKYESLDSLNRIWGRCSEDWCDIELPRSGLTVTDFVDWREFHLDTMTTEAKWRLDMTRERDPDHVAYLHVVPNTMEPFNAITCVDDFALAEHCDVFAATMNGGPVFPSQVISAARGKVCYNVESHVNFGSIGMHQRTLTLHDLLADFIPQVGLGVKGFLFWQYRPEVLGAESPAWGLVAPDGSDRPITKATQTFWATIAPHVDALMQANPREPQIGIWKSRKNEIFHFGVHGTLDDLRAGVEGHIHALHNDNYPFRIVSERMLAEGDLGDLKLLIMPSCYYVSEEEAASLDAWVRAGGVLLCEAHLAGYNATTNRHARVIPGCGLSEPWGIREADSTSSFHLSLDQSDAFEGSVPEDVQKALDQAGTAGGRFFPIRLTGGGVAWGAFRYAVLEGTDITSEGSFDGAHPCIVSKPVGDGFVLYAGTNLGEGASQEASGLVALIRKCAERAGLSPTLNAAAELPGTVHVDALSDETGSQFMTVCSQADQPQTLSLTGEGAWRGLFTGVEWSFAGETNVDIPARFVDLFVRA